MQLVIVSTNPFYHDCYSMFFVQVRIVCQSYDLAYFGVCLMKWGFREIINAIYELYLKGRNAWFGKVKR